MDEEAYKALLERLDEGDKKVDELEKKLDDVTKLNAVLLSRKGNATVLTDDEKKKQDAIKRVEAYLNGD